MAAEVLEAISCSRLGEGPMRPSYLPITLAEWEETERLIAEVSAKPERSGAYGRKLEYYRNGKTLDASFEFHITDCVEYVLLVQLK